MSDPVNNKDVADQISKLYELHQAGVLSKPEFEQAKHRLLGNERPRLVAQPPPGYRHDTSQQYRRNINNVDADTDRSRTRRIVDRIFLVLGIIFVSAIVLAAIGNWLGESGDDDNNNIAAVPTATTHVVPATPVDPTATAIPRTGIQNFTLSITVLGDWEAWGEGCVGGGDEKWVDSDTGVIISPADVSGTFRGRALGAGDLQAGDRCQWFVNLTSRASDSYRITIGEHDVVCHSNKMLPTDDGFYAAVVVDADGISCASVTSVSDSPSTPEPSATP